MLRLRKGCDAREKIVVFVQNALARLVTLDLQNVLHAACHLAHNVVRAMGGFGARSQHIRVTETGVGVD